MSEAKASMSEAPSGSPAVTLPVLFGTKKGMTRVYDGEGRSIPVSVISLVEPTIVTQVKSTDRDGYCAVQLGFRSKKQQRAGRAEKGHFQKAGSPGFYHVEELRLAKADDSFAVGASVSAEFLQPGVLVDIQGTTKGKGFQGVMKVWNFGGQPASHGHSVSHRSPGSIGNRADPGRVFPGHKMAKHMGMVKQTTQNLKVISYDPAAKLLLIEGAVPGAKSWTLRISTAKKVYPAKPQSGKN